MRFTTRTFCLICLQAIVIQNTHAFLCEAHIHVLANMFQRDIVVMCKTELRLCCIMYQAGYVPHKEITRSELRACLCSDVPPVMVHWKSDHFTALLPQPNKGHMNIYEIDDD